MPTRQGTGLDAKAEDYLVPARPSTPVHFRVNGQAVGAIRALMGWSQTEFAAMIGIDRTVLAHIEAGRKNASPRTAKLIADGLKTPIGAILMSAD